MSAHAYLKNEFTEDKKMPKSHELAQINLKRDPSEMQRPKFENSRLGLTESAHEG